jgi:tetratricopeptide (TPR) repeat protein
VKLQVEAAYRSHQSALAALEAVEQTDPLPEAYRYELARTWYFLSNKSPDATAGPDKEDSFAGAVGPGNQTRRSKEYREAAIAILEDLTRENPQPPDYRFLLALCYRPTGIGPEATRTSAASPQQQAIAILEELTKQYPAIADYRYELTATYAWVHVGLFPWQGSTVVTPRVERNLRKALKESRWLVAHHPTIPDYARSETLIVAKLGTVYWRTGRLAEAKESFASALQSQSALVAKFPDLSPHSRVLLEFVRLRLAQVLAQAEGRSNGLDGPDTPCELLTTCVENLTQLASHPGLKDDRLAQSSLQAARDALRPGIVESGRDAKAQANESGR